jgi:methylated-DNA-[protein]-cysteine S-methyltransferase
MSSDAEFALFDTAIGRCGIAWGRVGVRLLQLPEGRESATRARILARCPGAVEGTPPAVVSRAMEAITRLLAGKPCDLSSIELDMDAVPPFHERVYEQARKIPPGTTVSYGELATRIGAPGSARAVGQALGRNPFAVIVPCHRVLAASGRIGGFSAKGGITTKLRLLTLETSGAAAAFDGDGVFGFDPGLAVDHLKAKDAALKRLIQRAGPFRMQLQRTPSVFGALSEAIVYQQLSGKAAATIFARLCALFPKAASGPSPEQILRASDQKLSSAGLSRSKLLSLRDLALRTKRGQLPTLTEIQRMDDEAVIDTLTQVRGIGRWTVEMLLILRLGRPDVLPVDDYGVRKGFALAFRRPELPSRKELEQRGERWRPYRSVASWYLWRALDVAG